MKTYKTIFFDLDHTLWDFDLNSAETITDLFSEYRLSELGIESVGEFLKVYREVNYKMWDLYHRNLIEKSVLRSGRFRMALSEFNIDDNNLAENLATDYLQICPLKSNLFPGAIEALEYLTKKYKLHIITNGFKEVQYVKIRNSGLEKFFDRIHISEEIGYKKPEIEIFNYAVKESGTPHTSCIMIGDNLETDIGGALKAGIDQIFFNPNKEQVPIKIDREIHHLDELKIIF